MQLPTGTVTFLFTDIEGSTERWERDPQSMSEALARHDALVREAVETHGGVVFKTVGDAFCAAFHSADAAVAGALATQRALASEPWTTADPILVRMAIHSGSAEERAGDYFGPPVNRVARLLSAAHGGQVLLSQTARDLVGGEVQLRELGKHRLKDLADPQPLYQLVVEGLPNEFPPVKTLERRSHNLPQPSTPLVGREREVEETSELLRRREVRLLTLTGPGGVGKTRLALRLAATMLEHFEDGVYAVPLASISDSRVVLTTVAQTLSVRESTSESVAATLARYLGEKDLLLVLDNVEQLLDAGPALAELLTAAPSLKLLVTSRAPLRLAAEQEYEVPALSELEAVELFAIRARAVQPGFAVSDTNAAAIAAICARVDHLPLAIELAAARIKLLSPDALADRLEQRLPLLTGGSRDVPARQQTLRSTIEWSYQLLDPGEQTLFRRLAIFVGGCTLEAAEAACAAELETLASLIDKSLVRQRLTEAGESRFSMLETIREYAREELEKSGEVEDVRRRHAAHFLDFAELAAPLLRGKSEAEWLERMDPERDNLRAALAESLRAGDDTPLRFVVALYRFWGVRGHLREARDWSEQALAQGQAKSAAVRATALFTTSEFARFQGDYVRATELKNEALAVFRKLDDRPKIASLLTDLGQIAVDTNDFARGRALHEESIAIRHELGERFGVAHALYGLACLAIHEGDCGRAVDLLEEVIEVARSEGERQYAAVALGVQALAFRRQGETAAALSRLAESLALVTELRDQVTLGDCLNGLGGISTAVDEPLHAARLWGAAEALREQTGDALFDKAQHDREVDAARTSVDPQAWAAAWSTGKSLTLDEAFQAAHVAAALLQAQVADHEAVR